MIRVHSNENIPETIRGRQIKHLHPLSLFFRDRPFDEKSVWLIKAMVKQFIVIRLVGAAQEEMCNLDQNGDFCGLPYKIAKMVLLSLSILVAINALLTL